MKPLFLMLGTTLAGLPIAVAFAQQPQDHYFGRHMWDGPWHTWFFGPLMMIASVFVVVLIAVLLFRWLGGGQVGIRHDGHRKSPVDILKERFARGEIDKEEFEERRRILEE
jgi:putative membrane protein